MENTKSDNIEDDNGDEKTKHISPHCHDVEAECDGDCFFDSVAQALRQVKPSEPNIDVKCLRKLCEQFANQALESQQPSWFIDHMDRESSEGRLTLQGYISRIGLTPWDASQCEKGKNFNDVVWGQVEVEGRIISEKYNVQLHITETKTVNGQEILIEQCMDKNGSISSHCNCKDEELIHIISRGNKHFEPALHSRQQQREMKIDNRYKNFIEPIQSNSVADLKATLGLFPNWAIHNLKFTFGLMDNLVPMICEKFQIYGPLSSEMHFFLEEEFGIGQFFATISNLSKEFVNENELLDAVCTSLKHYLKYAEYFLVQKGVSHHRLNHAFFLLLAKQYESWMEIRSTSNAQFLKSIPRTLVKKIQVCLTKLLFPLGEYAKILSMNDQIRQMRLDFLKVNEYPMKYLKNAQKHEYFDEMDKLKALYQTYNFGEFQLNLVYELYSAFSNPNQQTGKDLDINYDGHYLIMKDIYVLDRILSYINLALSMEIKAEDLTYVDKLLLERALQVTGEYLKNSDDAPNLSEAIREKLNRTGVKVDTLTELRNLLSHHSTKQAFSESSNDQIDILLGNVRADLQKVKTVIAKVVRQLKIKQIHLLLAVTHSNVSSSKSNNKKVVEQIQSVLDDVRKDTPSKDMKDSFEVLLNILKKHTNEELGDIRTSVQELLFVILPDVILQPLRKQDQEIWINSALFQKINNGKLGFSDNDWPDSNSVITRISSLKLIEKYKETKLETADDSLNSYGLTLTDVFVMVISENAFSNKRPKAKTKKFDYGFQSDLDANIIEKLGIQNTLLHNALSAINESSSEDQLNQALGKFAKGSESSDNLFKLLNIEENRKEDFESLLDKFRLHLTQIAKPIEVLDNILESAVRAIEKHFNKADFQQINLNMKNKKEAHIAKIKLSTLCGGIKEVSENAFVQLAENLHYKDMEKNRNKCYSNRRSCKTTVARMDDFYGELLNATGKDLKAMKQSSNKYTNSLEIKPQHIGNVLQKSIERVIEEHFGKQFHDTIVMIENLRQEIKKHDEQALQDDVLSHFIHKKRMMAAMEMVILKALNIISAISTPAVFKKLEQLIHVTIGHSLGNSAKHFSVRNYLAHGDAIIEMRNANLMEYLNCAADFLVQHGRVILAINRIVSDSINCSVLLAFLSVQSLNEILDQNPALYGGEMEILHQSEYWKNQIWKTDLLNLLLDEENDGEVKMLPNFHVSDFIEIVHEEMCTAVSFGDFNSIQFFLNRGFLCQSGEMKRLNMLHHAAENGNLDVIHLLLKQGFQINATDATNCTPLHLAVLNQRTEAVRVLLDNKADVRAKDSNGYTAIHMAAYLGNTDLVLLLIEGGADSNDVSKLQVSPLFLASWNCHYDATVALIEKGALVNLPNDLSMTPLFCAAAKGQFEMVELLLKKGSKIDGHPDCAWSPLQIATIVKHRRVVELLISKGATIDCRNVGSLTPLHYASTVHIAEILLNADADVHCSSDYGTPLHTAAHEGCAGVVKLLVRRGARVNAPNTDGLTAMHFMAFKGDSEMLNVLIDAGASVDAVADSTADKFKKVTPLHLACSYRQLKAVSVLLQHKANANAVCFETETNKNRTQSHWPLKFAIINQTKEIVNELLKHSADVNVADDMDLTALHFAALKGPSSVVQMLLNKNADVNAIAKNKMTPIFFAALSGFCDVMEVLIEHGADIRHKVRGETLLHVAVQRGHLNAAKLLIEKGIDVNSKGVHSKTALHWACVVWDSQNESVANNRSKLKMVQMLLENKADPNAPNFIHDTPLHIAAHNGDPEIVKALLEFGGNVNARNSTNMEGLPATPLQSAEQNGHIECFQIMKYWASEAAIPKGEDPANNKTEISSCADCSEQLSTAEENWISELCKAVISGKNANFIDELLAGNTFGNINLNKYQLLHICAAKNDLTLMKKLLDHGLDRNHLSIEGLSPLHLAVKLKFPQAAQLLLQSGADVNGLTTSKIQSALHFAVQNEDIDAMGVLLERDDINVDYKNISNETPLMLACQNGSEEVVRLLIKHNAQINQDDKDQDAAIHAAVKNNQTSIVEILFSHGANIQATGKGGNNPLHCCMPNGNLLIAQLLINDGATVNCVNDQNYTPLHLAAELGRFEAVEFLLHNGAKVDGVVADIATPLHLAVSIGNLQIAETLMANKANVNAQNGEKQTALHLAVITGDNAIVESLLRGKAQTEIPDNNKRTPLFLAIKHVHSCVINLLLQNDANVNAICQDDWPVLHAAVQTSDAAIVEMVLEKRADIHCTRKNGWTPLHFASSMDSLTIVALLIARGADVNKADKTNEMPIHIACYSGYYDLAEKLIAARANVNCFSVEEFTPLYMAVEQGRHDIINLLLANKADVNLTSPNAQICAMDAAILNMDFITVDILIEKGADVHIKSENGTSFMHSAACVGSRAILEILVRSRLSVDERMDNGATPLQAAVERGHIDCVRYLIEAGADINATLNDRDAIPPLCVAIQNEHEDIALALVEMGANVNLANAYGDSPLMYAVQKHMPNVVLRLINKGAKVNATNSDSQTALQLAIISHDSEAEQHLLENGASSNAQLDDGAGADPETFRKGSPPVSRGAPLHKRK